MKNTSLKHILGAIAIAAATQASAQDLPESFNYQAMINAEDGSPIANKDITVEVSILQGSNCGNGGACPTVWQELHTPKTNDFGLFNIEIGSSDAINTMGGTAKQYGDINWLDVSKGEYFLKVRVDFGEASYLNGMTDMGTTKFSAVPYSLVAMKCDNSAKADALTTDANGNTALSLTQMKDVTVKNPSTNQILVYDGSTWKNTDPTQAQGLTNININSPSNGQYLVYNATSGKWENMTKEAGAPSMSDISDASIKALNNKDVLVYNSAQNKWYNQPLTMAEIQGLGSANTGDVLQYDGTSWRPAQVAAGSSDIGKIGELTDVNITSVQPNQVLSYDESTQKWVNKANDNIWAKNTTKNYYTDSKLGIGSNNSIIKSDDTDKNDLLKIANSTGEGTTHFTGKGITVGNGSNRATGVGSIALAGGSPIEGPACIGGKGAEISNSAENTIVMGASSSSDAKTSIIIGDGCHDWGDKSAMFGSYLTNIGENALICGYWNKSDTKQLFAVGNGGGTEATRNTSFSINTSGDVYVGGTLTHSSDSRLKTNVSTIESSLDKVLKMRGVTFNWDKSVAANANASDVLQYGFIAQEIEKILPALVSTNVNGYKSVNYMGVIPVLTEAIKDQQTEIEDLKKENEELKSTLEALLKRVEALENK